MTRMAEAPPERGFRMRPGRLELPPRISRTRPSTVSEECAPDPSFGFAGLLSRPRDDSDASGGAFVITAVITPVPGCRTPVQPAGSHDEPLPRPSRRMRAKRGLANLEPDVWRLTRAQRTPALDAASVNRHGRRTSGSRLARLSWPACSGSGRAARREARGLHFRGSAAWDGVMAAITSPPDLHPENHLIKSPADPMTNRAHSRLRVLSCLCPEMKFRVSWAPQPARANSTDPPVLSAQGARDELARKQRGCSSSSKITASATQL